MNGCQVFSPLDCHGQLSVKMMNLAINRRDYFIINKHCHFIIWEATLCLDLEGERREFQFN